MITTAQYFQAKPHSDAQRAAAQDLLVRVDALEREYEEETGEQLPTCPNTGSAISGSKGGQGDGGFRLPTATTGGEHSSHKCLYEQEPDGTWREEIENPRAAVDRYDPQNAFDNWITDEKLEAHDLYREAPESTPGWAHLTTRPPHSGRRTFKP